GRRRVGTSGDDRRMKDVLRLVTVLIIVCAGSSFLAAQEQQRTYYTKAGGPAGVGRYEPGTWGAVGVQLANPGESPAEVLSVMSFQQQGDLQFGRKIWLPARSRRLTSYPVRVPEEPPVKGRVWQVQSLLFEAGDDSETPIPATFG